MENDVFELFMIALAFVPFSLITNFYTMKNDHSFFSGLIFILFFEVLPWSLIYLIHFKHLGYLCWLFIVTLILIYGIYIMFNMEMLIRG
jgi:hypothetical protein